MPMNHPHLYASQRRILQAMPMEASKEAALDLNLAMGSLLRSLETLHAKGLLSRQRVPYIGARKVWRYDLAKTIIP